MWLNATPGALIEVGVSPPQSASSSRTGSVTRVYLVRNPHKLTRLTEPAHLAR